MACPWHGQAMGSPGLQPHHASWPSRWSPSRTQAECPACLAVLLPAGHGSWRGAAPPAVLPEWPPRMQHYWGAATMAALLALEEEIWELGTHAVPGEILPGKCRCLCWGAELMYSHGLLPAPHEWKPLSTGRAGLRDQWDLSHRQELPAVPRLPSLHLLPSLQPCIPSAASTGILRCDSGPGRGGDAALSCLASGGMLRPCPIPPSPQRNKEHPLLLHSQISVPAPLPWKLSCLSGC